MGSKHEEYRDHIIYYDPPPIPTRACDWHYYHKDYDGEGDNRAGSGPSAEACKADIDHWWSEQDLVTEDEKRAQALRCTCRGGDDYCACQNAPDATTMAERRKETSDG